MKPRLGMWALFVVFATLLGAVAAAPNFDRMRHVAAERFGPRAGEAVDALRTMLAEAVGRDAAEQLEQVNTFFNRRIAFDDDARIWGQNDYWATPVETLGKGAGDCEDFSIAKYLFLRELGIPNEQLRLIYVRAQIGGPRSGVSQAHMVLGFYATPNAEPLILDNLIGEIRPASRRPDLVPIFSFNSQGLWVGGSSVSSADPTTRLSRWRDLLERTRNEGLQ